MAPPVPLPTDATSGPPLPLGGGLEGASRGEKVYRVAGGAVDGEVGQDLADHAGELVAVPGEPGGDSNLVLDDHVFEDAQDLRGARASPEVQKFYPQEAATLVSSLP